MGEGRVLLSKWSHFKVWVQSKSFLSLRKCWDPEGWVHNPNTCITTDQAPLEGILRKVGSTVGPRKIRLSKNWERNYQKQIWLKFFGQSVHGACLVGRNGSFGGFKVHLAWVTGTSQTTTIKQHVCRLHPFHMSPPWPNLIFVNNPDAQWSTFESVWRPVFKVKRKSWKFSRFKSMSALKM